VDWYALWRSQGSDVRVNQPRTKSVKSVARVGLQIEIGFLRLPNGTLPERTPIGTEYHHDHEDRNGQQEHAYTCNEDAGRSAGLGPVDVLVLVDSPTPTRKSCPRRVADSP
jgi:hypothetical protein